MSTLHADEFLAPELDLADRVWLKITNADHRFVSSGVLFFRGECDAAWIRARVAEAFGHYPKLRSVPDLRARPRPRWRLLPSFDVLENFELLSVEGRLHVHERRLVLDQSVADALARCVDTELVAGRPLWKLTILRGLRFEAEPVFCLIFSTHHCVADGVAYYDMLANLLQHPDRGRHHVYREPDAGTRTGFASRLWGRARYLTQLLVPEQPITLANVTSDRASIGISVARPIAALMMVAKAQRVSLNAVALAALGRALREYARARSGTSPSHVRAILPVSMHRRGDHSEAHVNKMGYCHVQLDLGERAPALQARAIEEQLRRSRALGIDVMMGGVAKLIAFVPTPVSKWLHRFFSSRATLVISCFPFPNTPLSLGDAKAFNIGAFPVIAPPMQLSAMIVTHAQAITLYVRSNSPRHDVARIVSEFARQLDVLAAPFVDPQNLSVGVEA